MASQQNSVSAPRPMRRDRAGSQSLPADRFDRLERTRRVGAHRYAAKRHRFWLYVLAIVLASVLLTAGGIIAVQVFGSSVGTFTSDSEEQGAAAPAEVQGEIDPTATVGILNGTETPNLQAGLESVITANSWGQIAFADYAAARDVQISAVFYSAPEDEVAAAGLARELGGVSYYQSSEYDEYGVRLVVLLGADYAGPGFDEAAEVTALLESGSTAGDPTAEASENPAE